MSIIPKKKILIIDEITTTTTPNSRWLVEISDENLAKDDTNRVIIYPFPPPELFILLKPSFIEYPRGYGISQDRSEKI